MWARDLLLQLVRRRIIDRYIGSTSVALWMVVSPLIPLLINLTIFYFIARIPDIHAMGVAGYAVFAFSGLLVYRMLNRAAVEGCDLLTSNLEMLKSVNFPLHYLSLASVASLLVDLTVQLVLMTVLLLWSGHGISASLVLLPVATGLAFAACLGVSWLLSIVGYLARETQEVLSVFLMALLYLSPALYPGNAAPATLQQVFIFNPLTHYVIIFRDALLPGSTMHWNSWIYAILCSAVLCVSGFVAIHRVKRFVADLV